MLRLALLAVAFFAASAATLTAQNCSSGCLRDHWTWGGGSAYEIWEYLPDILDADGTCYANCTWSSCTYNGRVRVTNNSGAARKIYDNTGAHRGTLQNGQTGTYQITTPIRPGCGNEEEPSWYAVPDGGGAKTSEYVFACTYCASVS